MPASDNSRWWIASEACLHVAVVVLPWSLGGAPPWTLWVLTLLGAGALMLWTTGAVRNHRRWGFHLVMALPAIAAAVALLQLLPLPQGALGVLSPQAAELREFALLPLGLDRWRSISMDPPATARALARAIGLGSALLVALELGRLEAVRRRLLSAVALTGISIVVCGYVHLLANADALFGVHRFMSPHVLLTPFGNPNHLAAYLSLTGSVGLGLALESSNRERALAWGAGALACGVGVFLSMSRGGIGTFVATWGLVGATLLARRGGGLKAVLPWIAIGATVAFAGLLAFDQLLDQASSLGSLDKLQATKVELWPMLARGALAYWPVGMGLGAFELGFSRFQTEVLGVSLTHPENLVLQWASEAGLAVTIAVVALAAAVALGAWRRVRDDMLRRTALVAIVGVGLHDLFDFAFELNAVAVTAAVVAGIVCSPGDSRAGRLAVRVHGLAFAGAATVLGVIACVAGLPTHLDAEHELASAIHRGDPVAQVREQALRAIDRHPADWVLYADVAGDAAVRSDPRDALAWVNRVLFLRPADARSHVAAGRALLRLGKPGQALIELKTAWSLGDTSSLPLGLLVAAKQRTFDRALLDTRGHLTRAVRLLRGRGQHDDADALVRAALEAPPSEAVLLEARVLDVVRGAETGEPAETLARLEGLPPEERQSPEVVLAEVSLLSKLGRGEEAAALLERTLARRPGELLLSLRLATLYVEQGKVAAGLEVLERARPFATSAAARSLVFQREAALWIREERWPRALDALTTASRIEPQRADLHYRLAQVHERMGSLRAALDEVRTGRRLDTPDGATAQNAWVDRLEKAQAGRP